MRIRGSGLARSRVWRHSLVRLGLGLVVSAGLLSSSIAPAFAASSIDAAEIRRVYDSALALFGELELDAALTAVDEAIATAQGDTDTPSLAALYLLRAALLYSSRGDEAREDIDAALARAVDINYFADFPGQLNSEGLRAYLKRAREAHGPGPQEKILDATQSPECDGPLEFNLVADVPEGGRLVVYWRARDQGEYYPRTIELFAASALEQVLPDSHRNANIDYYIVVLDASDRIISSLGEPQAPIKLENPCAPAVVAGNVEPDQVEEPRKPIGDFGPFQIGLGFGTGFGIAHGQADKTPQQFAPGEKRFVYGASEAACAAARWGGEGKGLPSETALWGNDRENPTSDSVFGRYAGSDNMASLWAMAYDAKSCANNHAVVSGLANAPLHIAPSFLYRVTSRFSVGLQARLQIFTGTNVYAPSNYQQASLLSSKPEGKKVSAGVPWSLSLEGRYEWLKEGAKLIPYVGGFAGYGTAKLRVDMGFAADVNGNSVPDNREVGCDNGLPVFPFNEGCEVDGSPGDELAKSVSQNASSKNVVDSVTIGSVMAGVSFGAQYLFSSHVGVAADMRAGLWFPKTSSLLIDVQVGPVFRF